MSYICQFIFYVQLLLMNYFSGGRFIYIGIIDWNYIFRIIYICIGIQNIYNHIQPGKRHTNFDLFTVFNHIKWTIYILQHLGGVDDNSMINIKEIDTNETLDADQPQLICHFPYYDSNKFVSTLIKVKMSLVY